MKAWVLVRHGDPQHALELRELPDPKPAAGQVLIRSEGFGLNYAETMAVRGLYRDAPAPPCVLGYEAVGRVEAIGEGAPEDLLGKRVTAITRFGGQAQMVVTDHRACAVIPDHLPLGEAAALATQGCTAWYAARVLCPLHAGERVLVHSAAGGVGHLIVQLAAASGCEVFAIAGDSAKCELVLRMGAAHAIDRHDGDAWTRLRRMLGPNRLDASFNAVGGASFRKDLRLLGAGGRMVIYGGAERGGMSGLRFVWRMGLVVPIILMMKSRSLLGINMLRIGEQRPDLLAECLRGIVAAHRDGIVKPHVQATYGYVELPSALHTLASNATMGKAALRW